LHESPHLGGQACHVVLGMWCKSLGLLS